MQVDPTKPKLKPPGIKRLKLKHNNLLSSFALTFNLCGYTKAVAAGARLQAVSQELDLSEEEKQDLVEARRCMLTPSNPR